MLNSIKVYVLSYITNVVLSVSGKCENSIARIFLFRLDYNRIIHNNWNAEIINAGSIQIDHQRLTVISNKALGSFAIFFLR